MYKTANFQKKLLATLVASSALGLSSFAFAQEEADEVVVTGIKASLTAAMDIKRDAAGVVDAISAEDIGKMPDANLSESLQRISGVSIDRNNGEGANVTVRGINKELNMVTLNGRNMPTVGLGTNGNVGDNATRAFDFSNIAAEGIYGVDVYKTGRADTATGGIGATINIKTLRPLDAGETKASFGVKGVQDTTNRVGADYTPEVSGLYSWVNEEQNFGATFVASHQVRDSGNANAFVNNWNVKKIGDGTLPAAIESNLGLPAGTQYTLPTDLRYQLSDVHRERDNAQLTLQFKPTDAVTTTLDYTNSSTEITSDRAQQSTWFNPGRVTEIKMTNDAIPSPLFYKESYGNVQKPGDDKNYNDFAFSQVLLNTSVMNNSLGANVAWEVNDDLKLDVDFHNSSAENVQKREEAGMAFQGAQFQVADFRYDLPVMGIGTKVADNLYKDGKDGTGTAAKTYLTGNANGVLDGGDISGTMGQISYATQRAETKQLRLNGSYNLGDLGFFTDASLNFGVESSANENTTLFGDGTGDRVTMGNWGGVDPSKYWADEIFTSRDFGKAFPDYKSTTSNSEFFHQGVDSSVSQLYQAAESYYAKDANTGDFGNFVNGKAQFNGKYQLNRTIEENIDGGFVQFKGKFEIAGMPANFLSGLRFEKTDVTSVSNTKDPVGFVWQDKTTWTADRSPASTNTVATNSYNNVLPSIDVDVSPTDDIKVRASFSQTIGRAAYSDLRSEVAIDDIANLNASRGNPELKPIESTNIDISAEWYYTSDSYVSVGLFTKDLKNFIGKETFTEEHFGIKDLKTGNAYKAAAAAAPASSDPDTIFKRMLAANGQTYTGNDNDFFTSQTGFASTGASLAQFNVTVPVNKEDDQVTGIELGIQHMFGDTGFGVSGNVTKVSSDLEFDNTTTASQFAMIGLSDTANFVAFYENDYVEVRAAYNWRDSFLNETTRSGANEPAYIAAYSQIDLSISYHVNEQLTLSAEGLNLTGENARTYGRSENQMISLEDLDARYTIGARYTF